jgi:hypothetical protein
MFRKSTFDHDIPTAAGVYLSFMMLSLYGPLLTEFTIVSRLEQAQNNKEVTEICLRDVDLTPAVCQALSNLLSFDNRRFSQVELYYCQGSLAYALKIIICSGFAESLCLFAGSLDQQVWDAIGSSLEAAANLTKLRFNVSSKLWHHNLIALFRGINSSNSEVRELVLNGCTFGEGEPVSDLAGGLRENTTLHVLSLDQCYLLDFQVEEITCSLENHPCLREFREFNLYGNICRRRSLRAIGKLLVGPKTCLESIDLTWQLYDEDNDGFDLSLLAQGLKNNRTLKKLNLSRNPYITRKGIFDFSLALRENATLEQLQMRGCNLCDAKLVNLASALPSNTGLKQLWLQSTQGFGNAGITSLVKGLRENTNLEELSLPAISDPNAKDSAPADVLMELQHLLDLNRCGRRLIQSSEKVPISLWPLVLDRIWTVDFRKGYTFRHDTGSTETRTADNAIRQCNAIYYLLREKVLVEQ